MGLRHWVIGAAALALAALGGPGGTAAEDRVLNVYNWNDYIGPNVVAGFEKETGVKVNYDLYDANETVEAKLEAGHSGYDIVVPTFVPFIARGIQAGLYAEIDHARLKNWGNADPEIVMPFPGSSRPSGSASTRRRSKRCCRTRRSTASICF